LSNGISRSGVVDLEWLRDIAEGPGYWTEEKNDPRNHTNQLEPRPRFSMFGVVSGSSFFRIDNQHPSPNKVTAHPQWHQA
jgi:hypothetical protein